MAERVEDERERHLLRHPLDEDRRAREEELGPLGVELAHGAERVVDVDRPQPLDRRHAQVVTADEIHLLERRDVEQARRVRREEDLVPALGEPVDEPVEVAMPLRGEEELGLLDREDDALDLARARLQAPHQSDARRGRALELSP